VITVAAKAWRWGRNRVIPAFHWARGRIRSASRRIVRGFRSARDGIQAHTKPLWQWIRGRPRFVWSWTLRGLGLQRHRGPGWLSYEIYKAERQARRVGPLPPREIRWEIAAPRAQTLRLLGLLFLALLVFSALLSIGHVGVPRLPGPNDRISVFTSMWQVQAGIAALALPVLTFVIERARDERHAALHSAEVLGRESWSFPIIGFSFVVLARMGIDLTLFSGEPLVFLTDVVLFLVTILATVFAYYRVLRITLSPSRLRTRSVALASEKTRSVLLHSVRVRIGDNVLFHQLKDIEVGYWPFGSGHDAEYLVLDAQRVGSVLDVNLDRLLSFVAALPWRPLAQAGPQPMQPAAAAAPADPSVWLLFRFGTRLTEKERGLVRLRGSSFADLTDADKRTLEDQLRRAVQIGETDEF
jgi:hypothetical protein